MEIITLSSVWRPKYNDLINLYWEKTPALKLIADKQLPHLPIYPTHPVWRGFFNSYALLERIKQFTTTYDLQLNFFPTSTFYTVPYTTAEVETYTYYITRSTYLLVDPSLSQIPKFFNATIPKQINIYGLNYQNQIPTERVSYSDGRYIDALVKTIVGENPRPLFIGGPLYLNYHFWLKTLPQTKNLFDGNKYETFDILLDHTDDEITLLERQPSKPTAGVLKSLNTLDEYFTVRVDYIDSLIKTQQPIYNTISQCLQPYKNPYFTNALEFGGILRGSVSYYNIEGYQNLHTAINAYVETKKFEIPILPMFIPHFHRRLYLSPQYIWDIHPTETQLFLSQYLPFIFYGQKEVVDYELGFLLNTDITSRLESCKNVNPRRYYAGSCYPINLDIEQILASKILVDGTPVVMKGAGVLSVKFYSDTWVCWFNPRWGFPIPNPYFQSNPFNRLLYFETPTPVIDTFKYTHNKYWLFEGIYPYYVGKPTSPSVSYKPLDNQSVGECLLNETITDPTAGVPTATLSSLPAYFVMFDQFFPPSYLEQIADKLSKLFPKAEIKIDDTTYIEWLGVIVPTNPENTDIILPIKTPVGSIHAKWWLWFEYDDIWEEYKFKQEGPKVEATDFNSYEYLLLPYKFREGTVSYFIPYPSIWVGGYSPLNFFRLPISLRTDLSIDADFGNCRITPDGGRPPHYSFGSELSFLDTPADNNPFNLSVSILSPNNTVSIPLIPQISIRPTQYLNLHHLFIYRTESSIGYGISRFLGTAKYTIKNFLTYTLKPIASQITNETTTISTDSTPFEFVGVQPPTDNQTYKFGVPFLANLIDYLPFLEDLLDDKFTPFYTFELLSFFYLVPYFNARHSMLNLWAWFKQPPQPTDLTNIVAFVPNETETFTTPDQIFEITNSYFDDDDGD